MDDLLILRTGGMAWPDIITIYDFSVSDVAAFITEIEKAVSKPKPRPKTREVERGFYQ